MSLELTVESRKKNSILTCALMLLLIRKALKSHRHETKQNGQIYLNRIDYHITGAIKTTERNFSKSPEILKFLYKKNNSYLVVPNPNKRTDV